MQTSWLDAAKNTYYQDKQELFEIRYTGQQYLKRVSEIWNQNTESVKSAIVRY